MVQNIFAVGLGALVLGVGVGYGAYSVQEQMRSVPTQEQDQVRSQDQEGYRMGIGEGQGQGQGDGRGKGMGMGMGHDRDAKRGNCLGDGCLAVDSLEYPAGELTAEIESALRSALDDEYKAWETYGSVMDQHGRLRPFVMIQRAEEHHISALKALFDKYGMDIIENPYSGNISSPASFQASCQVGVDAEIANAALYRNELLPAVNGYEDIEVVFTNLMNASQERHLPAFQRCAG